MSTDSWKDRFMPGNSPWIEDTIADMFESSDPEELVGNARTAVQGLEQLRRFLPQTNAAAHVLTDVIRLCDEISLAADKPGFGRRGSE